MREKETMRNLTLTALLTLGLATTVLATTTPAAAQQPPSPLPPSPLPPAPLPPPPPEAQVWAQPPPSLRVQDEVLPRKITDWDENEPIPPGYRPIPQLRTKLVVAGAVTLGSLWALSAIVGASMNDQNNSSYGNQGNSGTWLFVPVIGPFAQLFANNSSAGATILVIDGLGQAAGAAMLITGLTYPKMILVREYAGVTLRPTPVLGRGNSGLGVVGTF